MPVVNGTSYAVLPTSGTFPTALVISGRNFGALNAVPTRAFGSFEALALYRVNAVDAQLKFAFEHGL